MLAEQIRTFIAIELDDALRRALAETQAQFQRERVARLVRWVAPANIHVTLKFLGDVDADMLPALERALVEARAGIAPFTLTIAGAGAFPNTRKPNVLWVGARGQVEIATRLAQRIEEACAALDLSREARAFSPHLTLGRVRREASPEERRAIGAMVEHAQVGTLGELHVARVSVMRSELRPTGSVYARLYAVDLQ